MGADRYVIERTIASGGAGTVFLARRSGLGAFSRRVAIKRLHAHVADDERLRRTLLREAQRASMLHHANVVPVVDVDEIEGALSLVMEWVDGASLAELLAASRRSGGAPIPTAVVVRALLDACAGLSAVHELRDERGRPMGLLHCDVSPQNLLVGVDGVARLADFGLAKITEASTATSTAGLVAGKLGYVAPEVIEGRPYSPASDLFALGIVTWEALVRRRVLEVSGRGATLAPPPPPSTVEPGLDPAYDAVVTRATQRDPSARFSSVRAFGEALLAAARRGGPLASPAEVGAWVRAHRPRGDEGARLRVSADGSGMVDHTFAETAALGDEGTPPLGDVETTDPITQETTPPLRRPTLGEAAPPPARPSSAPPARAPRGPLHPPLLGRSSHPPEPDDAAATTEMSVEAMLRRAASSATDAAATTEMGVEAMLRRAASSAPAGPTPNGRPPPDPDDAAATTELSVDAMLRRAASSVPAPAPGRSEPSPTRRRRAAWLLAAILAAVASAALLARSWSSPPGP